VTVAVADTAPFSLVAVSVKVVVELGVTSALLLVTSPTPWSMERLEAPETDHDRLAVLPRAMVAGLTENAVIAGRGCGGGLGFRQPNGSTTSTASTQKWREKILTGRDMEALSDHEVRSG
jgi:hypothetical protein